MPSVDVVIIGAGIVGISLAAELAGRGAGVVVCERQVVAAGASGRNSGAVWYPADAVLGALYRETLARYRRLAEEVAEFTLGVEPAGILTLGWDADALREQAARTDAELPALGARYLDPDTLRRVEPGLAEGLAAVRLEIGFPVAPAAACQALATVARRHGAEIREGLPAMPIRDGRRTTGVSTPQGAITSGAVVVAAGPWSPGLIDPTGSWAPIRPSWGVIVDLGLEPVPQHILEEAEIDAAIEPDGEPPSDADGASGFSLVTAAGRSSLGSTFLPEEPDPRSWEARLRAGGTRYLPAIATSPTLGLRACARPLARDGRPLVGPVPGVDGLFIAAGHGPWGISTGPASAAHVAALIVGDPDPRPHAIRTATDAARFGGPPARPQSMR